MSYLSRRQPLLLHGFFQLYAKIFASRLTFHMNLEFQKLARNTAFASLQPFRSIKYTSSMSLPCIRRISDFLSKP